MKSQAQYLILNTDDFDFIFCWLGIISQFLSVWIDRTSKQLPDNLPIFFYS